MDISINGEVKPDFGAMIKRSRDVADGMSKGIQFLFKKNKIDTIQGNGKIIPGKKVEVTDAEGKKPIYKLNILLLQQVPVRANFQT